MKNMQSIIPVIQNIEVTLSRFYQFPIRSTALNHLIDKKDLALLSENKCLPEQRAATVIFDETSQHEDLFIGIFFDQSIIESLVENNPINELTRENLDAFWVIVEEISHFHLILNRAQENRTVTQLELEWQGEIDKLLLSAIVMKAQSGNPHYFHLARILFEQSEIYGADLSMYSEANNLAARYWYKLLSYTDGIFDPENSSNLKTILQSVYSIEWSEKYKVI